MNILRCTAIVILLVGLVACNKRETMKSDDDGVIRIASSTIEIPTVEGEGTPVLSTTQTRSMTTTTSALKDIFFYFKESSMMPTDMTGGTTATGNRVGDLTGAITWTSAVIPTYDKKNNMSSFYVGCWPGSGGSVMNTTETMTQWKIDGKTDIMTTKCFSAGTYASPIKSTMVFKHRLAALEVIVKGADNITEEALNAMWGKISRIELLNTSTVASFLAVNIGDPYDGIIYSTPVSQVSLLKGATYQEPFELMAIPPFEITEVCASGMFAAISGPLTLRIHTTVGSPVDVIVQLKDGATNKNLEMGKKHIVTLVLTASDRKVRVENTIIEPWGIGGESSNSTTPPSQTQTPENGFLDWNYTGLIKSGNINLQIYAIPTFTYNSYNSHTIASNGGKYSTFAECIDGERPFMVLEVAKANEKAVVGTEGWNFDVYSDEFGYPATWATAYAACKAKAPAGKWRLPRASELALMFLNRLSLEKTPGFAPLVALNDLFYWSSTESDNTNQDKSSWAISLVRGLTESSSNNDYRYVRCVSELTLDPPAVGNYYFTDGSYSSKMESGKVANGMIYYVDSTNSKKFKVMALDRPMVELSWASSDSYEVGAINEDDGRINYATIRAAFDKKLAGTTKIVENKFEDAFPAAGYCYNYTGKGGSDDPGTWYLPAKNEMQYLYCAFNGDKPTLWDYSSNSPVSINQDKRDGWNALIVSATGNENTSYLTPRYYWSSTEATAYVGGDEVLAISLYDTTTLGFTRLEKDPEVPTVRCVRDI